VLVIGPMLGRLSPLRDLSAGQEFPVEWKKELASLDAIGANCTEWVIVSEEDNPLFSEDLSSYPITSVNLHWMTIEDLEAHKLNNICEHLLRQKIFNLTIPLMDCTSLIPKRNREKIIDKIINLSKKYSKINFSLETELRATEILPVINLSPNLYVTYDTGNTTSYGYNHRDEIMTYGGKINNVHLKDRIFEGPSVKPFSGETNFKQIFECLKKINYCGPYILETFRGERGNEFNTVKGYIEEFKCLI